MQTRSYASRPRRTPGSVSSVAPTMVKFQTPAARLRRSMTAPIVV
jgi:hypothetical protein